MCDHLVDPALYRRMAEAGAGQGLRLGVDRRLGHPWIDPDDVTCVEADGTRIVAIGKGIEPHNAYDTGVFAVTTPFFDVLERLESPRSEEHTSELQSLMRISYAVFCLKKKTTCNKHVTVKHIQYRISAAQRC